MSREGATGPEEVLLEFQSVMSQFLETQQQILASCLLSPVAPVPLAPVAAEPALAATPALSASPDQGGAIGSLDTRPPVAAPASPTPAVRAVSPADRPTEPVSVDPESWSAARRLLLRATSHPLPSRRAVLAPGAVIVTDDGGGVAASLAVTLRAEGRRVVLLQRADGSDADPATVIVDTESPDALVGAVRAIVDAVGAVAAFVHLWPLAGQAPFQETDAAAATRRLHQDVRGLFLIAQALRPALMAARDAGGAAVIAATGMGGAFGTDTGPAREFDPGQAGVAGLTKCLAIEWPDVRVRAVDMDLLEAADRHAAAIHAELWADESCVEIGYCQERRLTPELYEAPIESSPLFHLPNDAVILATGGARGITAEICQELADRFTATFVLVGQTPLPELPESAHTADLVAPADLKRALMARLAADGTKVTAPMVERAYRQLVREREMRRNVGAITATGSHVHYVALDVRDDGALTTLVRDIYDTYGRLDGLIHGAGVIEDKLVEHKSVESFDRVFETKTRSAWALARAVRPESLRFAVFFSSVAGRFGNRGQADYAAANEVVNKLAIRLNRAWPCRVSSLGWAPWDKSGMVSPELKREFAARGVALLDPRAGRQAFWQEIQQSRASAAEVVIAASAHASLVPGTPPVSSEEPLLVHGRRASAEGGGSRWQRTLDPDIDHFLADHRIDGRGVLPLAFATELMAEAAARTWPDLTVTAVHRLQLLKGIIVGDEPVALEITVRPPVHDSDQTVTRADVEIVTPGQMPPVRYRCVVELAYRPSGPDGIDTDTRALRPFGESLADASARWTFHGPLFRRLTRIDGIADNAAACGIYSSSATSGIRDIARADWTIDPYVFDAALQMLLIWSRWHNDKTALPSRFQSFRRFGSLSDTPLTVRLAIQSLAGGHAIRSDVYFLDRDGRVLGVLEGMEASCSAELNRVAGA
jgi:NAD(P)-dependent dehydrogenase (short-subunit alcohol dehydrogenase family)